MADDAMADDAMADDAITALPPATSLPSLPKRAQNAILDLLFEPSVALHALAEHIFQPPVPTLSSYKDLCDSIGKGLNELANSGDAPSLEVLGGILCAHPRLGEKKVESAMSRMEQAAMGGGVREAESEDDKMKRQEEEDARLRALNAEYEERFPGLRYVVFVNGRSRPDVMQDMMERIARADLKAERREAIKAMCDIALDRANKLQPPQ